MYVLQIVYVMIFLQVHILQSTLIYIYIYIYFSLLMCLLDSTGTQQEAGSCWDGSLGFGPKLSIRRQSSARNSQKEASSQCESHGHRQCLAQKMQEWHGTKGGDRCHFGRFRPLSLAPLFSNRTFGKELKFLWREQPSKTLYKHMI